MRCLSTCALGKKIACKRRRALVVDSLRERVVGSPVAMKANAHAQEEKLFRPSAAIHIVLATVLLLATAPSVRGQVAFTEVGAAAGVGGDVYGATTMHGLGAAWIDYNRDTWPDLFLVNGYDLRPHLLRNNGGDGTFTKVDELLPPLPNVEMMGARFGDIDGDGDDDLFIYTDNRANIPTAHAGPPKLLLVNQFVERGGYVARGQPLFVERAAAAGVDDLLDAPIVAGPAYRSASAAFFDYDRDGDLDLFVAHWMAGAEGFEGHAN